VLIKGTPIGGPLLEPTPIEDGNNVEEAEEMAKLNRRLAWAYAGDRGSPICSDHLRDRAIMFLKEALRHGAQEKGVYMHTYIHTYRRELELRKKVCMSVGEKHTCVHHVLICTGCLSFDDGLRARAQSCVY
jgi:hypothetical protein